MKNLTLALLAKSAAGELFDAELQKVLANIADVNTKQGAWRELSLKLRLRPVSANREENQMVVEVGAPKLAGPELKPSVVYVGRVEGKLVALSNDPTQMQMFDPETGEVQEDDDGDVEGVTNIQKAAAKSSGTEG